jgi:hypothetical protein
VLGAAAKTKTPYPMIEKILTKIPTIFLEVMERENILWG